MLKLGLTGGIAAGKSTVGRLLADKGALVLDADNLAHETYAPAGPAYASVVNAFGQHILVTDGGVDRAKLAELVFQDGRRMAELTAIVWPHTRDLVVARAEAAEAAGTAVLAVEAALLLEAGWQEFFNQVWYVRAPQDVVLDRLAQRGLSASESRARLAARSEPEKPELQVDALIENGGDLSELGRRVDALWLTLAAQ